MTINSNSMFIDPSVIEAAYCAGFEPSSDTLTAEALYEEAQEYLFTITINN